MLPIAHRQPRSFFLDQTHISESLVEQRQLLLIRDFDTISHLVPFLRLMTIRILKKSASSVLASLRASTGTQPPHHSAARTDLVLLIRRTVRPRGYAFGTSLAAALLDSLFEYPACCAPVVPNVPACACLDADRRTSEIPACPHSFSTAYLCGITTAGAAPSTIVNRMVPT